MRTDALAALHDLYDLQKAHLEEAKRVWANIINRLQINPNQSNPLGVWQREQLEDMVTCRILIVERLRVVQELEGVLRQLIPGPKPKSRKKKR
jgi:hypothetical protein